MKNVSKMLDIMNNSCVFSGEKEKVMNVSDCPSEIRSVMCRHEDYVPFTSLNSQQMNFIMLKKLQDLRSFMF